MWVGPIKSIEDLNAKGWGFPKKKHFYFKTET